MIYCVEDDASVRDMEVYALESTGHEAIGLEDGAAFWRAMAARQPELILLDVMLPSNGSAGDGDEDGVAILRRLKANPDTERLPVIMATAKGAEYDKIVSLDLGADDYLVKPFGMMEMISRIHAVLRRCAPRAAPEQEKILRVGGLVMKLDAHMVMAKGAEVALTLKEFEVLRLLMAYPGRVFTRDRLLSEVWGQDYDGETRTVDVHIRTLRQKLGDCGAMIGTVRGLGYRMEVSGQ